MSFRQITVTSKTGTRLTLGARLFDDEPLVELSIAADDGARATIMFDAVAVQQIGPMLALVSDAAIEMELEDAD
jgi:hypothetical protein